MKRDEALFKLKSSGFKVFRTSDVSTLLDIDKDYAAHILAGLSATGHLTKLKRGLWGFTEGIEPMLAGEWLTAPFPAYVSLQSALYLHGMISQIPVVNYFVSTARTQIFRNKIGVFSIHHIAEDFFFGHEKDPKTGCRVAVPEKALLDFIYLGPAKTRLFTSLPEMELTRKFSVARARKMISKLAFSTRRTMLSRRFESIIQRTESSQ